MTLICQVKRITLYNKRKDKQISNYLEQMKVIVSIIRIYKSNTCG